MSYYLAPSLKQLRDEINDAYPNRDKSSDGWIGDAAHSARVSDHNPDYADGGVVRAIDIDEDGIDTAALLAIVTKDPRVSYVIYEGQIWGGTRWRKYTGSNMHRQHIHVSIKHTNAAESGHAWGYGDVKPTGKPSKPKPSKPAERVKENSGNSAEGNKAIAKLLNALGFDAGYPDGVPGPRLRAGVKAYQQAQEYFPGMKADGNWGPMTQAHFEWVRDELQPTLNGWKASKRVSELALDGSYGPLVRKCVRATQADNYALYQKAGGYYKDGLAGPITCAFLGVKKHPSA